MSRVRSPRFSTKTSNAPQVGIFQKDFYQFLHNGTDGVHSDSPAMSPLPQAVDLSPLTSLREDTVAALWKQLEQVRVIHVRGTPTSGKSTLALLLELYVRNLKSNIRVWRFSWPADLDSSVMYRPYYHLLNVITGRPPMDWDDWPRINNTLLIIDEAQLSYDYHSLWNDFVKPLASSETTGPMVILFSSYGSPSETPVRARPGSAPVELTTQQRVSARPLSDNNPRVSLYFTPSEFDDVVERVCRYHDVDGQPFRPSAELLDYIWEFSNGHPGGARAVSFC